MLKHSFTDSFEEWLATVPRARMGRPTNIFDRAKYFFWTLYAPLHTYVRDFSLRIGIVRHEGRQQFLIGKVAPDVSVKDMIEFLVIEGYGKHHVAWKDEDEVISLRKTHDFRYQYHLRIFIDGEVRGHFEYTPECRPWKHLKAVAQQEKREEFLALLSDWIIPA